MSSIPRPLPHYRDLPSDPSKPPRSAWGVFGQDDQVGTINLLTPERVCEAATLVRKGAVFSLNWSIEEPNPPQVGRGALRHTILKGDVGTEDYFDNLYTHGSSQWDALSHIAHPQYGFYNGCTLDEITGHPGSRNGIDQWARRGIVGRFVLADLERYCAQRDNPIRQDARTAITVGEVDAVLASQGVALREGDILLLRFGWVGWYEKADEATRRALAGPPHLFAGPGLSHDERTAEWLWDHHVAAVAADCPALEVMPEAFTLEGFLHFRIIPLLGLAVGEMFVLDPLAADCAADGIYEGLFTAAPLNKVGGCGSPANALGIK